MAQLIGFVSGMSYEEYFKKIGFSSDPKDMFDFSEILSKSPLASKNLVNNLKRIAKYNWDEHKNRIIPIKVARENEPRQTKIYGFLGLNAKILLEDINEKDVYITASMPEMVTILKNLE